MSTESETPKQPVSADTDKNNGQNTFGQTIVSAVTNSWPAAKIAEMSTKQPNDENKETQQTTGSSADGQTSTQSAFPTSWPAAKIATVSRITSLFKGNQEPIVFPPAEWALPENDVGNSTVQVPETPNPVPNETPISKGDTSTPSTESDTVPANDAPKDEPAPEAATIAERIRAVLANMPSLPTKANGSDSSSTPPDPPEMEIPKDGPIQLNDPSGRGPPVPTIVGSDSKLMQWLSSETVMNGSLAKGSQSVWSALDSLRRPKQEQKAERPSESSESEDDSGLEESDESFMVYAPLQPQQGSKLELADTLTPAEELTQEQTMHQRSASTSSKSSKKKTKSKKTKKAAPTVWKAHPTQLSLEALWWGYRIYLPPAIVNILDSGHLKAAQRASMITASLKWLFDQVPTLIVPAQFRPTFHLMKSLTPYLGYLGVVITWSWGKIKALDEGNGVILTATWLLPVALIPSTWKPGKPPTKKITTAAPEASPSTQSSRPASAGKKSPDLPPPNSRTSSLSGLAKKYFGNDVDGDEKSTTSTKGKGKEKATST